MKIKFVFASLLCFLPFTLAHANPCDDAFSGGTIHCAWINGLGVNPHDGRYIKMLIPNEGSFTGCSNSSDEMGTVDVVDDSDIGVNTAQYFICSDSSGTNCSPVGTDVFTIAKSPVTGKYTATPQIATIVLSSTLKDAYPKCDPYLR